MSDSSKRALVVTPPAPLPAADGRRIIFLAGSIDEGDAPDWQSMVIAALRDEAVIILNPRRKTWNHGWQPDAANPDFRAQVEWELAGLERADTIAMHLTPGSLAPISLLELGLHAASGKLLLCCADGYWRKGNVEIVVERYGIRCAPDLSTMCDRLRRL